MENENTEVIDSPTDEVVVETTPEIDVEALKQTNKELYERAKKAEKALKEVKPVEKPAETPDLSNKDILYLAKADVHEDDIDEVLEWAKFKKVDVKEAHKQLKGVLDTKAEQRRSAEVTQTKGSRGASKPSNEDLISRASKGQLPDKDEDIEALAAAEMATKIAKSKR